MAKTLTISSSIASRRPDLMAYWDYERNTVSANLFSPTSTANVFWRCPDNPEHYWIDGIDSMSDNCSCPGCNPPSQLTTPKKMQSTKRCFSDVHPDIAVGWYQPMNGSLKPDAVSECSGIYVWWKCKEGHVWKDSIAHRVYGRNCPYCSGKRALAGFNDFATVYPDKISEWDTYKNGRLLPYEVTWCSGKKVGWVCCKNHRWDATVAHRAYGTNCPYCVGLLPIKGVNDLETVHPDIARQWHPTDNGDIKPEDVSAKSNQYAYWLCELGHKYRTRIAARTGDSQIGCPYCSNRKVLLGFNDLYTTNRDVALEWDIEANGSITPFSVVAGCNKKYGWKCMRGHKWTTSPCSRVYGKHNCPYCSGRLPIVGETDLETVSPELARQWDKKRNGMLTPQMVTRHSTQKVWWTCIHNRTHHWLASPASRHDPNVGCPICNSGNVTSFPEKALMYYMPNDALANTNLDIPGFGRKTVDIFIPSINTAIEYDGGPWHKDTEKDLKKDQLCSAAGITMIRVRDCDCPKYETDAKLVFRENHSEKSLECAINTVLEMIGRKRTVDLDADRFFIQQLVRIPPRLDNGEFIQLRLL